MNHDPSAPRETIQDLFSRVVRSYGGNNFLISDADGSVFTYADAAQTVGRIMSALASDGVKKGDVVCMYGPVSAEAILLFLAAANLGAVFVPLDFNWPERMLGRVLGQIKPKIFFCEHKNYAAISTIRNLARTVLFDEQGEDRLPGSLVFSQWLDDAPGEIGAPEVAPDDDAVIIFTSGSTGDPKGVVLSQRALHGRGRLTKEMYQWVPDDIFLFQADIHIAMGPVTVLATLHAGCSFLVTPVARRANALSVAECIKQYGCTWFFTVPMALRQFMQFKDRIHPAALDSLRSIGCGGSTLSQELADAFYGCFRIPLLNCYGTTEVGWGSGHTLSSFLHAGGSVGPPVSIIEIVDANGNVLENGATGELRLRNDYLMSGYYQNPELTAGVIRDGWYYTGDLARIRPDGHIVIVGRIKNFIKHGNGELICFEEVEAALEKHRLVREAAVCGFTSVRGDERLAAFIVPDGRLEDPAAFFRELRRHLQVELSSYKVPALFYLKDRLPRSNMGKVLREPLTKEIAEP
jgi:acyl-coenzyme A synthetase/AMP-(fatty) acid ligase